MSTVPFGKYKGRPVEEMLADADYMGWLEAQPWFRERFAHLTKKDAERLERTPVHNRLQALFLDPDYCMAFSRVAVPLFFREAAKQQGETRDENIKLLNKAPNDLARAKAELAEPGTLKWRKEIAEATIKQAESAIAASESVHSDEAVYVTSAWFELDGVDVFLRLEAKWGVLQSYGEFAHRSCKNTDLRVEIKPVVADDYPAILRQMRKNKSQFLFIVSYGGEGANEQQFIRIFNASGIIVVKKAWVDQLLGVR